MTALKKIPLYLLALFFLVLFGFPFLFLLLSSFKAMPDYMRSVWALPTNLFFGNYQKVLSPSFFGYFLNSIMISGISVALSILVASMASYAFAKIPFRFSKPLFMIFLVGMMVPVHTTLIPIYKMMMNFGLYNNKFGLIGPYVSFTMPISIFIITQFFREVPGDITEAATIDGCSQFKIYWRIMLPLSTPAIATVGIYNFLTTWNEFIYALVLIDSPAQKTLPLGIRDFYGVETVNIPAVLTAVLVGSMPVMLFYFFAQEKVINGLSAGAVKA